ncbi:exonuclease mut-7 homolog [Stomoxys calcitrans]|uniref:exonuclease mut-7 homolog n=1 Tax=Stomoxys calcitrans TaxID=35570 RepID=UPI0027E31315|nr:exonuclease mut-7 homolog [Stomoxys calcitrans]
MSSKGKYRGIPAGYEDDDENCLEDLLCSTTTQNLKITVVPDITAGAGLNGEDFDNTLSADMDNWFEDFKETFGKCKRTPATQNQLKLVLQRSPQPLLQALKLFASSPGCNYLKNKNMALFILETVCELYKQQPTIEATCDDNTRMVAFNFVKTCGITPLYKAVTDTYQLKKIQNYLIPKLQKLLNDNYHKDAAYWSIYLECTHIFGLFDLLLPLLLQDKINLAEEFLNVAKEQQLPTVQFLDSLLDRKKTVYENCDEILKKYKYSDVKHNILSYRPMSKLVTRLAKKYNIDPEYTPNLKYSKSCSYLHYLYHKYQEGGMSLDSWRELAREEAKKSKALQLDLITRIATSGDWEEALYWVEHYRIPLEECPPSLQSRLENSEGVSAANSDSNESWGEETPIATVKKSKNVPTALLHKDEYLRMKLPTESIILVDTQPKFLDMLKYLEQFLLIGFDSEWKPSVNNDNRVSLIQLATAERVYLVDCLSPHLDDQLWKMMGRRIFNNFEILKLGFSLHNDLQMLHKSLPLQLNLQATSCYLDLRDLWRRLKYMQIALFPYEQISVAGESLCALTEVCLGKKLDKSNQFSNWANRPLRHDQITYAALDAHCLLQIYQVLTELLLRVGIDIDDLTEEITTSKSGYLFRTKSKNQGQGSNTTTSAVEKKSQQNLREWGHHKQKSTKLKSTTNIKFLCDGMLIGLSKELRTLGLDSLEINEGKNDINYFIDLARSEQRIVLTRDSRYLMFSREFAQSQCMQIPADSVENQVKQIVQYFQLRIEPRHLLSRCLECNGNDFLLANRYDMQIMRFGQLHQEDNGGLNHASHAEDRAWNLQEIKDHNIEARTTPKGKPIKVKRIKPYFLYNKDFFYICDNCGHCSWQGDDNKVNKSILATIDASPTNVTTNRKSN